MTIFKTYDIRGIYPSELNEDIVFKIGRAYADILKEDLKKDNVTIVVGRDMRLSSPKLTEKLIEGIIIQGVNVVDVGLVSTPTFYFAVSYYGYDGGMQISASHNPKEYNGVKVVRARAYPVSYDTGINEIKKRVEENEFKESKKKGKIKIKKKVLDEELKYSLKYTNSKIKPLKVVADAANAMGSLDLDKLFSKLPCELIKMNFKLDGTFPSHQADPFQEKNIKDLKKRVKKENADLGIATDGDGDRIFFVDDKGQLAEPSIIRGIMSKIVLREHPGAKICYDIRPGRITYDMIVENGGVPIVTKVGHSLIKAQAIKENAEFAGESSGHFFVKMEHGLFEMPMIITLKLLEEISNEDKKFSEILTPLRKYSHSGEINSKVKDKEYIMRKIEMKYADGKINKLDGITIEYDDFWFNVRTSNTESLLRLNLEAKTEKIMKEKTKEILKVIRG